MDKRTKGKNTYILFQSLVLGSLGGILFRVISGSWTFGFIAFILIVITQIGISRKYT